MRIIAVFTGARAEYSLLRGVMQGILQRDDCALKTIVSGSHLDVHQGSTIGEIKADGIPTHAFPEIATSGGTDVGVCTAMGLGLIRFSDVLQAIKPDVLVLLGDRFESFIMAAAATVFRIPIAHIHGGETTEGVIDEAFRHSLTKMSHLHFTSCELYRKRVMQLGEAPERVFNVGALGVENVKSVPLLPEEAIRAELGLEPARPYLLCTFHPETLDETPPAEQIAGLFSALEAFPDYAAVFTGANADPGGTEINGAVKSFTAKSQSHRFFMSLGQKRYFSAVRYAACVLGNSSSGIVEVPSFGTPVADIGNRQKGRVRAESVLHCGRDKASIVKTLSFALTEECRKHAALAKNPYDLPGTAKAIVETVASWPLEGILHKHFYAVNAYD